MDLGAVGCGECVLEAVALAKVKDDVARVCAEGRIVGGYLL